MLRLTDYAAMPYFVFGAIDLHPLQGAAIVVADETTCRHTTLKAHRAVCNDSDISTKRAPKPKFQVKLPLRILTRSIKSSSLIVARFYPPTAQDERKIKTVQAKEVKIGA